MIRLFSIFAFAFVSACAVNAPEPSGERIHIKQLIRETSGRPYECNNYDAASDTCEIVARRKVSGDRISYDVRMLMPAHPDIGDGPLPVKLHGVFQIQGDRYCGNLGRSEVEIDADLSPSDRSLAEELIIAGLVQAGNVCGAYYEDDRGYIGITERLDGTRVPPQGDERVHFFAGPKRVRVLQ